MEIDPQLQQKITHYKPDNDALQAVINTPIVLLVGIAGAGKNTVLKEVLRRYPETYRFIVSHVTRKPRSNDGVMEQNGVEYHFIDFATADRMLDRGEYVEANIVHYSEIYGTTIEEIKKIRDDNKIAISDVEVKGVQRFIDLKMNVRPIFIIPPSAEIWWNRLLSRYGNQVDRSDITRRMRTALEELEFALSRDYYFLIINNHLNETVDLVQRIALGEYTERSNPVVLSKINELMQDIAAKLERWQADHSGL